MEIGAIKPEESIVTCCDESAGMVKLSPIAGVVILAVAGDLGITGGFEYPDAILATQGGGKITTVLRVGKVHCRGWKTCCGFPKRSALSNENINRIYRTGRP